MLLENAAALVRDDIVLVNCQFVDKNGYTTETTYSFKCLQQLAKNLSPGDEVLVRVKARNDEILTKVAVVHEVQNDFDIDTNSNYVCRWLFAAVPNDYLSLEQEDSAIVERLKQSRRQAMRQQALEALGIDPRTVMRQIRQEMDDTGNSGSSS